MDLNNPIEKFDEYWIGEVPEKWKPSRIKNITCLSPGLSGKPPLKGEEYTVLPMEAVTVKGEIDNTRKKVFEDISTGLTHFENGDVLFAKITPCMENGKGAYVNNLETKYGFGSTEFHVIRPGHKVDGTFLYYYTYNPQYRDYAALNMTGAAGQKRVSSRFLAYTRIHLPEIKQQKNIARFLNKAIASIDTTITIKQKQLKILEALKKSIIHKAVTQGLDDSVEMKDSGVEWLGKIPGHWKIKRIKDITQILRGKFTHRPRNDPSFYGGEYPFIQTGEVTGAKKFILSYRQTLNDNGYRVSKEFPKGTLVMTIAANIGDVAILDFKACFPDSIVGFYPGHKTDVNYLYYLFTCMRPALLSTAILTTQLNLNNVKIGSLYSVFPPKSEQIKIACHLDEKISQIEKLKKNIVKQIETLELYRKSIVHECVTGKRRITQNDLKE